MISATGKTSKFTCILQVKKGLILPLKGHQAEPLRCADNFENAFPKGTLGNPNFTPEGTNSQTLSATQIPKHTHYHDHDSQNFTGTSGHQSHSHSHSLYDDYVYIESCSGCSGFGGGQYGQTWSGNSENTGNQSHNHTHTTSTEVNISGKTSNNQYDGSQTSFDNQPQHISVRFLIKY